MISWVDVVKTGHTKNLFGYKKPIIKKNVLKTKEDIIDVVRKLKIRCTDATRSLIADYVGNPYTTYLLYSGKPEIYKGFNIIDEWDLTEYQFPSQLTLYLEYKSIYYEDTDKEGIKTIEKYDFKKLYYRIVFLHHGDSTVYDSTIAIAFFTKKEGMELENLVHVIYEKQITSEYSDSYIYYDTIKEVKKIHYKRDVINEKKRHITACEVIFANIIRNI